MWKGKLICEWLTTDNGAWSRYAKSSKFKPLRNIPEITTRCKATVWFKKTFITVLTIDKVQAQMNVNYDRMELVIA